MAAKHAPAPWKIVDQDKIEANDGKGYIAYVYGVDNPRAAIAEESRANAALIAAAAELLAACEFALKYAALKADHGTPMAAQLVAALSAAVAKANAVR